MRHDLAPGLATAERGVADLQRLLLERCLHDAGDNKNIWYVQARWCFDRKMHVANRIKAVADVVGQFDERAFGIVFKQRFKGCGLEVALLLVIVHQILWGELLINRKVTRPRRQSYFKALDQILLVMFMTTQLPP